MTAVISHADDYVAAVASALDRAGVTDPERQELLDDLASHLAELEAETSEDADALVAQLGSPADYAAELLSSAGIDVETPSAPEPLWRQARAAGRRAWSHPRLAAARRFLPELRPGWWVLRAWAILVIVTVLTNDDGDLFPVPQALGNPFLSILVLLGAAVASVRLGRRRGWIDRLVTAVGVVGVVVAMANGSPRVQYQGDAYYRFGGQLTTPEGSVVENIWPYDANGNPLDGVLLFDQYGQPITLGELGSSYSFPGLYPQDQTVPEYDPSTGQQTEVPVPRPPITVPRLPGSSSTTSTTTPATTTTVPPPAG